MYRDVDHAPAMMENQSVTAEKLHERGIVDRLIPALGSTDAEADSKVVIDSIAHALWEIKLNSTLRRGREQRLAHYERLATIV